MKSKQIYESKLKCEREKEIWSQRRKLIPDYVNPLTKLLEEEKNRMKQEEKKEILEKEYSALDDSYEMKAQQFKRNISWANDFFKF